MPALTLEEVGSINRHAFFAHLCTLFAAVVLFSLIIHRFTKRLRHKNPKAPGP